MMLLKFNIIKVNAFLIMTLMTFSQVLLGLLSVWNVSFLGYPARVNLFKILVECNGPKEGMSKCIWWENLMGNKWQFVSHYRTPIVIMILKEECILLLSWPYHLQEEHYQNIRENTLQGEYATFGWRFFNL